MSVIQCYRIWWASKFRRKIYWNLW